MSLALPPDEPSELEQLVRDVTRGVLWFVAHPRFLAGAALLLSSLCYSHRLPSFPSLSLAPAAQAAQEHP